MEKGYLVLLLLQCMAFPLSCNFGRNNPFDEGGPNFIPPQITINEEASGFKNQDTIHFDSVNIVVVGNREQCIFTLKVDDNDWMEEWKTAGTFGFGGLTDGAHTLYINSMYRGGEMVVTDSISFYVLTKGYKPVFRNKNDTTITLFEGKPVITSVKVEGASPLHYSWLKGTSVLEGKTSDTLKITSFTVNDSASYKCIVSNEYGMDTSRTFILKYRPFSGGIKGIVADSSGKNLKDAMITLSPSNKKDTTDSTGSFSFTSLSGNSYTLQISLSKYQDTTLLNVMVNDSETVVLQTIKLKMIDTTTYKIAYNGNENDGGTVPSDTTKYSPGSKIVVAGIGELSKIGYTFSKWNTKKDGSGAAVSPGDSFTVNGNVTFYAHWIVKQYTLSFNGNGSTSGGVPGPTKYDYQQSITLPGKGTLEHAGYSFAVWDTKKDGTGKAYSANDTLLIPATDVELFAQWKALPGYKVTYNSNGADTGKVPVDSNSYYKGKEVTIAGNPGNLYRDGYSFSGWNTKSDGTVESYNAGAKFSMPDSAVTLYVKWSTNPIDSITYHEGSSTDGNVPATVNADSGMQVTIADSGSLYKTGYTFVGWNTKEDGSGKAYKTGDKVAMGTVNIDLYAQWTKAQYSITYYGNGNTGGTVPPVTKHFYGSEIVLEAPGTLQKTGHTFFKWNNDSVGNGIDYASGDKITVIGNMQLFAKWIINEYSIVFNTSGGSTLNTQTVKYGDTVVIPAIPLKNSYVFDGWHNDSTCTEKWNFTSSIIKANATLYAKWVIKDIDGNIYTEVKIGSQVWMVENLKTTKFNTGSTIPLVVDSSLWRSLSTPGYCWYYNDTIYKALYGALYNWYAVESGNLAPSGWHVPTENEWKQLEQYLIANGYNWDGSTTDNKIAKSLAAKTRWEDFEQSGSIGFEIESNNKSGFSAFPSGFRNNNGTFQYLLSDCYWWSTTAKTLNAAWSRTLNNFDQFFAGFSMDKVSGFSVRCIKDY